MQYYRTFLFVLCCFICTHVNAQSILYKEEKYWGVKTNRGVILHKPIYDSIVQSANGFAVAWKNSRCGYIALNSSLATEIIYRNRYVSEDLSFHKTHGALYGYDAVIVFNRQLKIVYEGKVYQCALTDHGVHLRIDDRHNNLLINKDDRIFYSGEMHYEGFLSDHNYIVAIGYYGRCGIINSKGEVICPLRYSGITYVAGNQYAVVSLGSERRLIDTTGKWIEQDPWSYLEVINRNQYCGIRNGYFYLLNQNRKIIYSSKAVQAFTWGPRPERPNTLISVKDGAGRVAIISCEGKIVQTPHFRFHYDINKEHCTVAYKNNKAGLLNYDGAVVLPFEYDEIWGREYDKSCNFFLLRKGDSIGVATKQGKIIAPVIHSDFRMNERAYDPNNIIWLKGKDQWGFVNLKTGNYYAPQYYEPNGDYVGSVIWQYHHDSIRFYNAENQLLYAGDTSETEKLLIVRIYNDYPVWLDYDLVVLDQDTTRFINKKGEVTYTFPGKVIDIRKNFFLAQPGTRPELYYYNWNGQRISDIPYNSFYNGYHSRDLLLIGRDTLCGLMDLQGTIIVPPRYKAIYPTGPYNVLQDQTGLTIMDSAFRKTIIANLPYESIQYNEELNTFGVYNKGAHSLLKSNWCDVLIPLQQGSCKVLSGTDKIIVENEYHLGLYDREGNEIIAWSYNSPMKISLFTDSLYYAQYGTLNGSMLNYQSVNLIRTNGEKVFYPDFDRWTYTHDGQLQGIRHDTTYTISKEGKIVAFSVKQKYPAHYKPFFYNEELFFFTVDRKTGIVTSEGDTLLPAVYEKIDEQNYGLCGIYSQGKEGMIQVSKDGVKQILAPLYDDIIYNYYSTAGYLLTKDSLLYFWDRKTYKVKTIGAYSLDRVGIKSKEGYYGTLDAFGNISIPFIYLDQRGSWFKNKEQLWGMLDNEGKEVLVDFRFTEVGSTVRIDETYYLELKNGVGEDREINPVYYYDEHKHQLIPFSKMKMRFNGYYMQ